MAKIKITLTKSPIGYNKKQRATAVALGLKKMHSSADPGRTPRILWVRFILSAHLVTVEEVS